VSFGVRNELPAGCIEGRLQSQARKDVEQPTILRARMLHVVGSHERQSQRLCHGNQATSELLLVRLEMPTNLDVQPIVTEDRA
jgi:hypothetical protein